MPWWSWLVIWVVLGLGLIGMLVWQGFRLFRKFIAMTHALGELTEKLDILEQQREELADEGFSPAIFEDRDELVETVELNRIDRERRRQIRRDSLVMRGKLLVRADAQQFSHLTKRN